ncbi:amidase [Iodidimonas sp. SYSU 1G8]|uniref:amidase n=1 Tax=Iodidimonas sp. SYSU 1G8 TaxID=3133967 RepID=UPI0031FEB34D
MTDIVHLSASDLVARYRRGALSPVEVTKAVFERIDARNEGVNAFILLDREGALKEAGKSEARWTKCKPKGLLDGVPLSIKEHIDVKGWPSRNSSPVISASHRAKQDAPITARLREAGGIILGKTATPEFCWKGVTDSALHGVSRNPWDLDKTPGGSSGGAAAACALGMGALHVGTDAGGSIRIPAAFCGVFGLRPTQFRVPHNPGGVSALISQAGPLTRTVADAALMMNVITRPDSRDPSALPYEATDYRIGLNDGVAGLRIGFWNGERLIPFDSEIASALTDAAAVFRDLGAEVAEADPGFDNQLQTFLAFWQPMTARYLENASEQALADSDPFLVRSAQKGAQQPIIRHYQAMADRGALMQRMAAFHKDFDLLLAPVTPVPPFKAGRGIYGPEGEAYKRTWTPFTFPFNITGQPAASVPCGFTKAGLPIGLQIVGPWGSEALILRAARALESVRPFRMPD